MSISDLLAQYNVDYKSHGDHHHAGLGWVAVDCPYCSAGWRKYRLGFELSTGRCNCWSCGGKHPVAALALVCDVDRSEAKKAFENTRFHRQEFLDDPRGKLKEPVGLGDLLQQHRKYLRGRGFNPDAIIDLWGIRGIGLAPKCQWRIYIPIYDRFARQVSWTTRSIGNHPQRYISASASEEAVSHKEVLYGSHLARNAVVVVEGPLDAWAIGSGAVATCGSAVTKSQMLELSKYPVRIVCLDLDAQAKADQIACDLSVFPGETHNVLLETGKDAADADPEEILELRNRYLET